VPKITPFITVMFCPCSCDEHYQTSEEHCGLDFDQVKTSFAKLLEKEALISEVMMKPMFIKKNYITL